jgi:hypothetical protein
MATGSDGAGASSSLDIDIMPAGGARAEATATSINPVPPAGAAGPPPARGRQAKLPREARGLLAAEGGFSSDGPSGLRGAISAAFQLSIAKQVSTAGLHAAGRLLNGPSWRAEEGVPTSGLDTNIRLRRKLGRYRLMFAMCTCGARTGRPPTVVHSKRCGVVSRSVRPGTLGLALGGVVVAAVLLNHGAPPSAAAPRSDWNQARRGQHGGPPFGHMKSACIEAAALFGVDINLYRFIVLRTCGYF